jgi:hypothetical protein
MRMLDLFCGRWGWLKAFAARGWECYGLDLTKPPETPERCEYFGVDILDCEWMRGSLRVFVKGSPIYGQIWLKDIDFICASSPCEQFSVHGMKHFHPNPPYPELGIKLFEHTRRICESSGVPYVMENVRAAQQFVGNAVHHCGPFYLWGTGVPPLMPKGIHKGIQLGGAHKDWKNTPPEERKRIRKTDFMVQYQFGSKERLECTAKASTIPPELANCVADYAERLIEQKANKTLTI